MGNIFIFFFIITPIPKAFKGRAILIKALSLFTPNTNCLSRDGWQILGYAVNVRHEGFIFGLASG